MQKFDKTKRNIVIQKSITNSQSQWSIKASQYVTVIIGQWTTS